MVDVAGAVALVTGGASGLGFATARRFVERGAGVVVLDLPSSPGEQVAEELGGRARFAPADVRDERAVAAALDVADSLGPLRCVVNCAGVSDPHRVLGRNGPIALDLFTRVVEINLVGTFNVLRLAVQRMTRHEPVDGERGIVINTASVAAFEGQIGQAAYSASKGGVVSLTLPAARELSGSLIRVVTIAPGPFDTPLLAGLSEEARQSLGRQVVHPSRLGRPEEFAALVLHVVENTMVNGEVIRLDGGIRMAPR